MFSFKTNVEIAEDNAILTVFERLLVLITESFRHKVSKACVFIQHNSTIKSRSILSITFVSYSANISLSL